MSESFAEKAIKTAMSIPGVKVDRDSFLQNNFRRYGNTELLRSQSTREVYSIKEIDEVASAVVRLHLTEVTALSAASGLPGGLWAIPASLGDLSLFYAQVLITAQKLANVYGMPDILDGKDDLDDNAYRTLIILLGVATGVEGASQMFAKIAQAAIKNAAKKAAEKPAANAITIIVVKILEFLGKKATGKAVGNFIKKGIPIASAIISGAFTYASFRPMSRRLKKELKKDTML